MTPGTTGIAPVFGVGIERVQPDRTYRVACNDYLTFGFAPFGVLKGAATSIRYEVDQLLRDTLREGLEEIALSRGGGEDSALES